MYRNFVISVFLRLRYSTLEIDTYTSSVKGFLEKVKMSDYDNTVWQDYEGWQNHFARFDRQDSEWESGRENESESSSFRWRPLDPDSPEWADLKVGEGQEIESTGNGKNASEHIDNPIPHTTTSSSVHHKKPFQQKVVCTRAASVDPQQQLIEAMELITQMDNAWDWNEIEIIISKYSKPVRQIALKCLTDRQKAMFKSLSNYRYR